MDMIFEDEDKDGPRGDFTRGVAGNDILRWQFGGKVVFSREGVAERASCGEDLREGWLEMPPRARICERGRSKWPKGRFLREGWPKSRFEAPEAEGKCKTGGSEA